MDKHKCIVVLSFDFDHPDDLVKVFKAIDPPSLLGFSGKVRVAIDPVATTVESWLDEDCED